MKAVFLSVCCILQATVHAWDSSCITQPVGFGYKTTGGEGGKTVQPQTTEQLKQYLKSDETLIIDVVLTFDFTDSEGTAESEGCTFEKCGNGHQDSLQHAGTCEGKAVTTVKYSTAGLTELTVSSNKSVISSNGRGKIRGKGLRIKNAKNVIVRDITISDINPGVIWAGDALALDNVENVWVHNCTFSRIARQHIVSYQSTNTGVTISSCFFDGTSDYAAYCDGQHYWVWLFWGTRDEITLINNHVYNTAGRTPHAGGWSKSLNYIHLIGNAMNGNNHGGIEPRNGSYILSEGNSWTSFTNPINLKSAGGYLAMVNDANGATACVKYLNETCRLNKYDSKSKSKAWYDALVLNKFKKLDQTAISSARAAICI